MTREQVLTILRTHEPTLRRSYFVSSLALFGSVARNQSAPASDVDLLVEFDRPVGYFHLFHTEDYLRDLLGGSVKVDLVARQAVIDELQDTIYGEAIDVFGPEVVVPHQAHS
jgi:predicted nucleotidyltransferase